MPNKACQCDGKVKHLCKRDAEKHLKRMQGQNRVKQTGGFKVKLHVYKCDFCECFHIGNKRV